MTDTQIKAVKQSWRILRNINPHIVGDLFYSKLFMDNPSLRKMFPKNMDEQYKKLVETLSVVVARLENLDTLTDDIVAMAQRHVKYGVQPAHYKMVGNALLWTLEHGLGHDWNKETAAAWAECYGILSNTMINAAKGN